MHFLVNPVNTAMHFLVHPVNTALHFLVHPVNTAMHFLVHPVNTAMHFMSVIYDLHWRVYTQCCLYFYYPFFSLVFIAKRVLVKYMFLAVLCSLITDLFVNDFFFKLLDRLNLKLNAK